MSFGGSVLAMIQSLRANCPSQAQGIPGLDKNREQTGIQAILRYSLKKFRPKNWLR